MLRNQTAWKRPWYYKFEGNSLINAKEEADSHRRGIQDAHLQ